MISVSVAHSQSCKSADTGLVCYVECLSVSLPACIGTNLYCLVNSTCVWTTCPELYVKQNAGLKPATSRLQVWRPNLYATMQHYYIAAHFYYILTAISVTFKATYHSFPLITVWPSLSEEFSNYELKIRQILMNKAGTKILKLSLIQLPVWII